jgi:5-hydroxyisourate hydrolase-like protein (transthyretin family)
MHRIPGTLVVVVALLDCSPVVGQGQALPGAQGGPPIARPGGSVPGLPTPRDPRSAPQTGTARVSGRVVSTQTGSPLRRAQISLFGLEGQAQTRRSATTDGEGRYEFKDLPGGRYSITATKAGYVTLQYGQKRPFEAGTPVAIAEGESLSRVDFNLPRGAVIAVRVTDDFSEPLAGAQVSVQRYQYGPDGQRRLTNAPSGGFGLNGTDDHGEFRVFGLPPGEYIVSAGMRTLGLPPSGSNATDVNEGFSPTFYPGTINPAEAQAISVGAGDETSVQVSLIPSRLVRISGTVVDSEGRPAAGAMIMLVTRTGTSMFSSGVGSVSADGTFAIGSVPPGEHSLDVRPTVRPGTTGGGEGASFPITVSSSDISNVRIVTNKGATIGGRVVFEGTSARSTDSTPLRVLAQQSDPSRPILLPFTGADPLANGVLDDAGNFQLSGQSGRVFLSLTSGPLWVLKSITIEGEDVTDTPIDLSGRQSVTGVVIRMSDKLTQITGQVNDARGQVLKDYVVVVLPAESKEPVIAARWIRTVRPDSNGRFLARGLRPGRYVAVAVEALEQGRQFAPEFQEQLRRGAREFALKEGESVGLDLTLTPGL